MAPSLLSGDHSNQFSLLLRSFELAGDSASSFSFFCTLAAEARGQPLFGFGEGSRTVKRRLRRDWTIRREREMRGRGAIDYVGRVSTLYKRKGVKVVPVDKDQGTGKRPEGDDMWREKALEREKRLLESTGDVGKYRGFLIPKFSSIARGERLTPARIKQLNIGPNLRPAELDVLLETLYNREAAIAFDSSEKGRFHNDIEPPHVIPTIRHKAWQTAGFRIPAALQQTSIRLLEDRLACGTIERSFGPYRNGWFLVEKPGYEKDEDGNVMHDESGRPIQRYRLINSAQKINAVTIRDASLPPGVDEFSERFAGFPLVSLLDLFSGYDQCTLAKVSRDITAFHTPLGLMRMTTLPMGYTNAVQVFDRIMRKVLYRQILEERCEPFLDDVPVKPQSRSKYPDPNTGEPEESLIPGVRRYVLESIQNMDEVLADIERAGGTVAGLKCAFLHEGLKIVAYVCDSQGRHPEVMKVKRIVDWPACTNITEAKSFIGLCVYYRLWIAEFSLVAEPIFRLFRRKIAKTTGIAKSKKPSPSSDFAWGPDQRRAMERLKAALVTAPALKPIVYTPDSTGFIGRIVIGVDASQLGYGAILQQEDSSGKRHPSRYESGLWTPAETRYDAVKLECRGLLRALKKFKYYVYGVHFLVEIDAKTLVHQLNQPMTDLPGAVVGRWLAYIRLFSFDIHHVPGAKHKGPDALSRRPPTERERREHDENGERENGELEEMIDGALGCLIVDRDMVQHTRKRECSGFCTSISHCLSVSLFPSSMVDCTDACDPIPESGTVLSFVSFHRVLYEEEPGLVRIGEFLTSFRRPAGMSTTEYGAFKREATKFLLREGVLYRRGKAGMPPRRVIGQRDEKKQVLRELHDGSGHRGRDATYEKARLRYFWKGLYRDIDQHVRSCSSCQKRRPHRYDEPLHPTFSTSIWMKLGLDVVHMPVASTGAKYMVGLRDDLSGWCEYRALRNADSKSVARFIYEAWISRYGCPAMIVNDGGPENQLLTKELLRRYNIANVQVAPYHPQSNGLVERGHQNIVDALAKITAPEGRIGSWVDHLAAVSWADRITVRRSTGQTPFRLVFAQECLLPVDLALETWRVLDWESVAESANPRAQLLALRARQLERRPEDLAAAAESLRNSRENNREHHDKNRRRRPDSQEIVLGDWVLLHDTKLEHSHSHKLSNRWTGPYKVIDATKKDSRGTYKLAELDGTKLEGFYAGDRIKKFVRRKGE